jgi:hypothetical protein
LIGDKWVDDATCVGGDKWDVESTLLRGSRELSIVFEIDSLILLTKTDIKFPALDSIDFSSYTSQLPYITELKRNAVLDRHFQNHQQFCCLDCGRSGQPAELCRSGKKEASLARKRFTQK